MRHAARPLLPVDSRDLERGLELYRRLDRLGAFDAVLAAAALGRQATALVSADVAFSAVPGLTAVVPDEAGVRALLGPASIRSEVDFPQPEGPTRTRNSPSSTVRSSASTAGRSDPGYSRLAPS